MPGIKRGLQVHVVDYARDLRVRRYLTDEDLRLLQATENQARQDFLELIRQRGVAEVEQDAASIWTVTDPR